MLCSEVHAPEIPLEKCIEAICYPSAWHPQCAQRIKVLRDMGIEAILSYGPHRLSKKLSIIGKGHAAVVLLAKHASLGLVAIKIRRFDSKRSSLELEGKILEIARDTGFVPKVYAYTHDFIIREFIDGITIRDYIPQASHEELKLLVISMIKGFAKLDSLGIDVEEVSKPLTQVIVECLNPSRPKLIDLESARMSKRSTSLTRFLGFLARVVNGKHVYELLGMSEEKFMRIRELANRYKKALGSERPIIVEEIVREIMSL